MRFPCSFTIDANTLHRLNAFLADQALWESILPKTTMPPPLEPLVLDEDDLTPADYERFYNLLPPQKPSAAGSPKAYFVDPRTHNLETLSRELFNHFHVDGLTRVQAIQRDLAETRKQNRRERRKRETLIRRNHGENPVTAQKTKLSRVVEALLNRGLDSLEGPKQDEARPTKKAPRLRK